MAVIDNTTTRAPKIPSGQHLSDMTEVDQVSVWKSRIRAGSEWRYRTSGKNDALWMRYKAYYRGEWKNTTNLSALPEVFDPDNLPDYVPANRIFSYIRSIIPNVYFRNPGAYVTKGKVMQGVDDRDIVQLGVDYLTTELKMKKIFKRAVLSTMITGTGIIKIGFGSEFLAEDDETGPTGEIRNEFSSYIKPGLPWIKDIRVHDFILPWGTEDIDDAPWCAQRVWRRLENARADKRYVGHDKMKVTARSNVESDVKKHTHTKDEQEWVELFEIRDKETGNLYIISDGGNRYHYHDEDVLMIEGFPYRMLTFDQDLDTAFGVSAIRIMEPQQLELNDIKTHEAQYRRRETQKVLVDPSAIVGEETTANINDASLPNGALLVNKPRDNVHVLTLSMPSDIPQSADRVDNDIRTAVAHGRNQSGDVNTGRRTAREITVADRAAQLRNDERRDITADFVGDVVNDVMQVSFKLMSEKMVRKITGGPVWHQREDDELPYNLGFKVNAEEARHVDTDLVRSQAIELYNVLSQNPYVNPIMPLAQLLEVHEIDTQDWIDPEIAAAAMQVLQRREAAAKEQQEREGGGGEGA